MNALSAARVADGAVDKAKRRLKNARSTAAERKAKKRLKAARAELESALASVKENCK